MKLFFSDSIISRTLRPLVGLFEPPSGHLPKLQAHSSCWPLNNSFSHHPQVAQRKQRDQLSRVFDQAPIPIFAIAKLAFNHPKVALHLCRDAGLDLFQLVDQGVYSFALLQIPALARHHGNLSVHAGVLRLNLLAVGDSSVARDCKHNIFFTVQQSVSRCDIVLIDSSARDRVNQARLSVCANVSLHAEVPLGALLGLVHPWVTLTRAVLSGAGSWDQSGINDRASFEKQAPLDQRGVDSSTNLSGQVVGVKQVAESENGALIRRARSACVELGKLTKQGHVVQCLFHSRIGQVKPLLHEMNAKHCCKGERRTASFTCRRKKLDQASQLNSRYNKIHRFKKLTLTRNRGDQFKSGCCYKTQGSSSCFFTQTSHSSG
jgi:hypothetical protein